jgi:DNA-binding response OmpR family regulator
MKILIVEDEPALRDSIEKYLSHQGFICEAVGDLVSGIEKVRT